MSGTTDPERWDVFRVAIPVSGGTQEHSVIVVTKTDIVRVSRYLHVVPIDTDFQYSKATRAAIVPLSAHRNRFLKHDSYAMCHWLLRIDKQKIRKGEHVASLYELDQPAIRVAIERVLATREQ